MSKGYVATVGSFDGIHLGHQKLFQRVLKISNERKLNSMIITFKPHPRTVLNGNAPPLLLSDEYKHQRLQSYGFDRIEILKFTRDLSETSPKEFIYEVLLSKFQVRHLVIGFNHHLGFHRSGDVKFIEHYTSEIGMDFDIVEPVTFYHTVISSTYIRKALTQGKVDLAHKLMGCPYRLEGYTVKGAGRGKILGFPTVNIQPKKNMLKVKDGVYAVKVILNHINHKGAAFVGDSPTFREGYRIEIHIPDVSDIQLSKKIKIDFFLRLRDIIKFDNISDLKKAIRSDINKVRNLDSL
ncbi:MAG: hypothetical protein APR63_06095 [Desulfuromonas sp. SDB]|nr:MAG: hypothetical protein APR63_06095 [Desulfuromonas sp. SDB]